MSIARLFSFTIRRVPSLPSIFASNGGDVYRRDLASPRVLNPVKPYPAKNGYLVVSVPKNGKGYPRYFHRLVAESFLPAPPAGHVIRHLDGDKHNNAACNLRWGTAKENCADTERHGRNPKGVQRYNAKLTDEKVIEIRRLWKAGRLRSPEIALLFGISHSHVRDIGNRKKWTHI